jgi:adenosylcobinamide-GDP ribazoletransferase
LNRLLVAIMFLTRIPVRRNWEIGAVEVGRSAAFFPLVGAGIGALQSLLIWSSFRLADYASGTFGRRVFLPASVLSVLVTALGVWITRALHLDGLADTADGFGGGRTREDVLRIMRDHLIGSFGAVALVLVLALKFTSTTTLIERGSSLPYLVLAPSLARASVVVLGFFLPYARSTEGGLGSSLQHIGPLELVLSSITALALMLLVGWRSAGICVLVVLLTSLINARICVRRIGGVTGDTLGANSEICEALVMATGSILSS